MPRFRKGDIVSIRTTVRWDQTEQDRVSVDIGYSSASVETERVELVVPYLNTGERVRFNGDYVTVVSVNDEHAWIKFDDGQQLIVAAADVDRIDLSTDPTNRKTDHLDVEKVVAIGDHDPAYQRKLDAVAGEVGGDAA